MPYMTTGNNVDVEYLRDDKSRPIIVGLRYNNLEIPLVNPLGLYNVLRDLLEEPDNEPPVVT